MAMKKVATIPRAIGRAIRATDPADILLFSGLGSLTLAAGLVHVELALVVFGLGAFYLGLMAGRTPPKAND